MAKDIYGEIDYDIDYYSDDNYSEVNFDYRETAKNIIEKGWVKLPEDSVVLTEEEAERFRGQTINIAKIKAQARKETAKEICDLILEHWQGHDLVECDWLIVAISEKYGVDMK